MAVRRVEVRGLTKRDREDYKAAKAKMFNPKALNSAGGVRRAKASSTGS